jgi:hypothetical protein
MTNLVGPGTFEPWLWSLQGGQNAAASSGTRITAGSIATSGGLAAWPGPGCRLLGEKTVGLPWSYFLNEPRNL